LNPGKSIRKYLMLTFPSRVLGVGMFSSASTWLVNVTMAVLREGGASDVALHFADSWAAWPHAASSGTLVVKSHHADAAMLNYAALNEIPVLISVRDPCDATASLVARFGHPQEDAAKWVIASCEACIRALAVRNHIIFRYEDGDLGRFTGVRAIARHLGMRLSDVQVFRIAEVHEPSRIDAYIRSLHETGVFDDRPPSAQWDAATHWHPNHVGDGRVGKFADILSDDVVSDLRRRTAAFECLFRAAPVLVD
jgi:hypothetical protein